MSTLDPPAAMKIPGNCKDCDAPLDRGDMERYVQLCEKLGEDPVLRANAGQRPGIRCWSCALRALNELVEDGHPLALRAMSRMRRNHLGLKAVK